jgi:hypothetical protein
VNVPVFKNGACVLANADKPDRPGFILRVLESGSLLVACVTGVPPQLGESHVPVNENSPAGQRLGLRKDSYIYGRSEHCIWVLPPRDCAPNGRFITKQVFDDVAKITIFLM